MKPKKKKYDIVSIGDCTIDAFVEVEESAKVQCDKHGENCQLCFSFGDKLPYDSLHLLPAGNSNNVAIGMSRLGMKSAFYGTVGKDHNSHVILNQLKENNVSEEFMSIQNGMQTNFHIVLWHGGERTILIKHQEYKYQLPKGIDNTDWIYFSSVGVKGLKLDSEIAGFLKKNPEIKMAFNPGTYQLRVGAKKLMPLFKATEILFLNKEEAEFLVGRNDAIEKLAEELHKFGAKTVVITDGLKGSYCLHQNVFYYCGIYPHKPIEATGAGDSFATGFTAAMMQDLGVEEALKWGARNGASVATKIGPQEGLVYKKDMIRDLKKHRVPTRKIFLKGKEKNG